MKRLWNLYIIIILLFVICSLSFILFNRNDESYTIYYTDKLDNEIIFYCLDEDNKIVSCSVVISSNDLYLEIFNIYNEYQNTIPINYYSPLNGILTLNSFEVINDEIIISATKLPKDCDISIFLECLKKTYSKVGINKITLNLALTTMIVSCN